MTLFIIFIEWKDWVLTASQQKCSRRQGMVCSQLCIGPYEEGLLRSIIGPGAEDHSAHLTQRTTE